jgi:hypothetical protein
MWFKLANADFSNNNLGKMSTLSNSISITYNLNNGFSAAAGSSAVLKTDSSKKLTLTLLSGWTCDKTPDVTVTNAIGSNIAYSSGKLEFTITPSGGKSTFGETDAVSSGISITISGAVNSGSSGGGDTTTWYINDCDAYSEIFDKSANVVYYGFAYQSDKMASVYNQPVNAIKVYSSSASGKLPVYRISTTNEASLIKEFTITKAGIQELKFDSVITLTTGENIVVGEINTTGQALIKFSSSATVPNGKFYVKAPSATQNYVGSAGFNIGYVV